LKATRDMGLMLKPSGSLKVDAYLDADFAGLYGHEKTTDPACAKSRTGFLISVLDCPMVWMSKLQSKTALSTMDAEIIALVHCCRELFPVINIVTEVGEVLGLKTKEMASIHVSITRTMLERWFLRRPFHHNLLPGASTTQLRWFGSGKSFRSVG
jgi:hypothetical protein